MRLPAILLLAQLFLAAGELPSQSAVPALGSREEPALPTRYPAARRIVAIGDLHGDLQAARAALILAGAIDSQDRWIGRGLGVRQTGDQLDRGEGEIAILELFERLRAEALQAGGAVHVLNGNHELMNAAGDFRYVTGGGFRETFEAMGTGAEETDSAKTRARRDAFEPAG